MVLCYHEFFFRGKEAMNTNIPDFSSHYIEIGQSLVDLLPSDFQAAWARMEVPYGDVWSLGIYYLKKNNRYGL
jgi:hypothetical protein